MLDVCSAFFVKHSLFALLQLSIRSLCRFYTSNFPHYLNNSTGYFLFSIIKLPHQHIIQLSHQHISKLSHYYSITLSHPEPA